MHEHNTETQERDSERVQVIYYARQPTSLDRLTAFALAYTQRRRQQRQRWRLHAGERKLSPRRHVDNVVARCDDDDETSRRVTRAERCSPCREAWRNNGKPYSVSSEPQQRRAAADSAARTTNTRSTDNAQCARRRIRLNNNTKSTDPY
jgi:hypothetical protein